MKKTLVFAAAACAALTHPSAASADEVPTATIDISDLDLTQSADREKLGRRIQQTARKICHVDDRDLASRRAETECRAAVLSDAVAKVELAVAAAREERLAALAIDHGA